jgi:lipoate-protein ligase A
MAVDEVLLDTADSAGVATLRFYAWSEPTLSLGYFQGLADRRHHPPSASCPLVRRSSGGGAIVHDCELTYSLSLPLADRPSRSATLPVVVHETAAGLIQRRLGLPAAILDRPQPAPTTRFLCFERRTPGDVVIGADKVLGSAQRRRRSALMQHGSLLLGCSTAAPELPGLSELAGWRVSREDVMEEWAELLEQALGVRLRPGSLSAREEELMERLVLQRYGNARWTGRR